MYQIIIQFEHISLTSSGTRFSPSKYIYRIDLRVSTSLLLKFEMDAVEISEMLANLYL